MPELASLRGGAHLLGGPATLTATASVTIPGIGGPYVDPGYVEDNYIAEGGTESGPFLILLVSSSSGLAQAIRGTSGIVPGGRGQVLGPFIIVIDGARVLPFERLLRETWVEEDEEGYVTFGFALSRHRHGTSETSPYMQPVMSDAAEGGGSLESLGPPLVGSEVDIWGTYMTETGLRAIRLVEGGLIDNASVDEDGAVRRFAGVGRHGRYERSRGQVLYPPGSGQRRGAVVRRLLTVAGVDKIAIGGDGTKAMGQPVELRDEQAMPLAREIIATEGKAIRFDPDGFARLVEIRRETSAPFDLHIDHDVTLSVTEAPNSEGPTSVLAIGHAQVLRADLGVHEIGFLEEAFGPYAILGAGRIRNRTVPFQGGGPTGPVPPRWGNNTISAHSSGAAPGSVNHGKFLGVYAPQVAGSVSVGGGTQETTLTGLSNPSPEYRLMSRLEHVETYDGDTILSERTTAYGWYNPEAAVGAIDDTAGTVDYFPGVYFYELGGKGYRWQSERFVKVSEKFVTYHYDDEGFLAERTEENWGYYLPRRSLKVRANGSTDWGQVDYITGVSVLAGGDGVVGRYETFRVVERRSTIYEPTPDGFLGRMVELTDGWFSAKGVTRWYNGGDDSRDPEETFHLLEEVTHEYQDGKLDTTISVISTTNHRDGSLRVRDEKRHGYLPAAPIRADAIPPGLYDDPEEVAYAAGASQHESREISAEVESSELVLSGRPRWQDRVEFPWAEDIDELESCGLRYLRDQSAVPVTVTMPANYLLRPGQRPSVLLPHMDLVYPSPDDPRPIRVARVRHEETAEVTLTTATVMADVI